MPGTLVTPSVTEPIKAQGFYSFVVSIPDDDFYSFPIVGTCGHIMIASDATAAHGMFWWRGTAQTKYAGSATTVGLNSVLNGTTGVDGNFTFGVASNVLYLENRTSANPLRVVVTLFTQNALYE